VIAEVLRLNFGLALNQAKLPGFSGRKIMKNSKSLGFSGV
jgi:hypothetical protein